VMCCVSSALRGASDRRPVARWRRADHGNIIEACSKEEAQMPRIAHFEIHAENPGKAAEFYGALFGWKMQHLAHIDYWLIDTTDGNEPGINGGIVKRIGPKPSNGQAVNAFVCTATVPSI